MRGLTAVTIKSNTSCNGRSSPPFRKKALPSSSQSKCELGKERGSGVRFILMFMFLPSILTPQPPVLREEARRHKPQRFKI